MSLFTGTSSYYRQYRPGIPTTSRAALPPTHPTAARAACWTSAPEPAWSPKP
ncbi:hypothetical protein ACFU5Y_18905 [Streptomyces gardneri]|uniref:hypothetical protein n=1 Tax=Streptomyces gardneri TaxID=66892 RepID=UPI003691A6C8